MMEDNQPETINLDCKTNIEDVVHIISGSNMSSRYYLLLRHDAVTKYLFRVHIKKHNPDATFKYNREFVRIRGKSGTYRHWWNISTKTLSKIPHNKPDVVIWNHNEKLCSIIEFSCPADVNISRKINEKMNTYGSLLRNLQTLCTEEKFEYMSIVVGALGYVPKCLTKYLCQLGFNTIEIRKMT